MDTSIDASFLAPRRCLREPVTELWDAAAVLDRATNAHLSGNREQAEVLLREANQPVVRSWTESLWGSARANPDQWRYLRRRPAADAPPYLPKPDRVPVRMPSAAERTKVLARYGRHCVFCGIPLIRAEVRSMFHRLYPEAAPWGTTNPSQHAGFQALWLQFDHVLPHCRGGDNSISNIVVTCAGCNFGRMSSTLEELGLIDPRTMPVSNNGWDGLERVLAVRTANAATTLNSLPPTAACAVMASGPAAPGPSTLDGAVHEPGAA